MLEPEIKTLTPKTLVTMSLTANRTGEFENRAYKVIAFLWK
jgi:hypothetical protein